MKKNRASTLLLLATWLLVLVVVGTLAIRHLRISTDLRSFMPPPQTADQKLLMDQIGEGPGSRLLLIAIEGTSEADLADLSRALAARLRGDAHFEQIINGAFDPASLGEHWLPY